MYVYVIHVTDLFLLLCNLVRVYEFIIMINNVLKMLLLSHVDVLGHRLIYEGTLYSTTSGKQ